MNVYIISTNFDLLSSHSYILIKFNTWIKIGVTQEDIDASIPDPVEPVINNYYTISSRKNITNL